jgi:hypothetical protein
VPTAETRKYIYIYFGFLAFAAVVGLALRFAL